MRTIIYLQVKVSSEKDEGFFLPEAGLFRESCEVSEGCFYAVFFPVS